MAVASYGHNFEHNLSLLSTAQKHNGKSLSIVDWGPLLYQLFGEYISITFTNLTNL